MFKISTVIIFFVYSVSASAFVETIAKGYQSCSACHISPTGGGVLTDYGRSLSRELLSTWGSEKSAEPLFGAVANKDNLKIGGDIRYLKLKVHNATFGLSESFFMQRNLELAYQLGKVWLVGTAGTKGGPDDAEDVGHFISERHYALLQPTDNFMVRVGKFRINYGLNDPNHTRFIKDNLGFPELSETYNVEVAQLTDTNELFLTASLGRIDVPTNTETEKSFVITGDHNFGSNIKIGGNVLFGQLATTHRTLAGIWGVGAVTENTVLVGELDHQTTFTNATTGSSKLMAGHLRYGYSGVKGLLPYLVFDFLHEDLNDADTVTQSPGVGIQFLPMPHFELQAEYHRMSVSAAPGDITEFSWLMMHFYL